MAIEIRLLQNNEDELANTFFNEIYKTNRPLENFRWEFRNGPLGKAIYVVAVDTAAPATKIVGIQCAIPLELFSPAGSSVLTAKSEDTLVHPDYRGQKLFERMYALLFDECKKAGIRYIWGFTPALKAFERIGFEAPFKTSQAILVLRPWKAYNHLKNLNSANTITDKLKIFGLCLLSFLKGLKRLSAPETTHAFREISLSGKDNLISAFYQPHPHYYFIRQNEAYLDWRLTRNPFHNQYKNFQVGAPSSPVADIILNVRSNVSYVEQAFFSSQLTPKDRLSILKNAFDTLAAAGTPLVRMLCFETNEEMRDQISLFKKLGAVHLKRGNYFVWKSLDDTKTISVENLFLTRLFTQGNV
jgi:GNAT superfamily N-acetyltransferase